MRACIVGPAPPLRGGISKHTVGLALAMRRRGHDVEVLSYARMYPRVFFPGSGQRDGCTAFGEAVLDTLAPLSWLRARRRLAEARPDVVVAQWWHPCAAPALLGALEGTSARVVVVCHNVRPHEGMPLWRALTRPVLRKANVVLCHSHFVADQVKKLAPEVECRVAAMPILIAPADDVRSRRDASRPTVLFAGHIRRYKGLAVMLQAWDKASLPPTARLVVAGESYLGAGKVRAMMNALCRRGNVRLIERWLDDAELWELLLGAHVLVLPYVEASQSGLLPLALAAGVRVVATDAGGLAEPLEHAQGHMVCGAGDSLALAAAVERALGEAMAGPDDAPRHDIAMLSSRMADSWRATAQACEQARD